MQEFIQLGTSPTPMLLTIPYPTKGKALFETSRFVDSQRNANGVVVGQQVGRSIDKQNMSWDKLSAEKWWEINRFFEENGMFQYCRYFSHNLGEWKIRLMYCSDFKCDPGVVDSSTGYPKEYTNCSFNVIDCGVIG